MLSAQIRTNYSKNPSGKSGPVVDVRYRSSNASVYKNVNLPQMCRLLGEANERFVG